MGLHKRLPEDLSEVDIIIAGGGTSGCVVASRLAEADPSLVILLIESGPNNDKPGVQIPALYVSNLVPNNDLLHWYKSQNESNINSRSLVIPAGRVLGGGSSVNVMIYSRPQKSDLDSWGLPGWSAGDMLPFLRKLETFHGPDASQVHGSRGPIEVSRGTYCAPRFEEDYISAARALGWSETSDLQTLQSVNSVERARRYINPKGKRSDAASSYLYPLLQDGKHNNLHVLVETEVLRILFDDNKTAIGVECRHNPDFPPSDPSTRSLKARRTIIASCGGIGTPLLMERSGIGKLNVLIAAGVHIVANVPGVGHEYHDHSGYGYPYKSSLLPSETLDGLLSGRQDVERLIKDNDSLLGWNAVDLAAKVRPTDAEVAALGPEFERMWNRDFKDEPDRPLTLFTGINGFILDPSLVSPGQYYSLGEFAPYPYSRGHIHITGAKINDPLDFKTGYLTDPLDIKMHLWAYKKQREVARRMSVYRGEVALGHPPFPTNSKAAIVDIDGPLAKDVIDIEYSPEDDEIIEKWLRENIGTMWHSLGTCKIGELDDMGVVDSSLRVHGVKKLRIADLSILPQNIGANTSNMAFAVGEKAADLLIRDLRLGDGS